MRKATPGCSQTCWGHDGQEATQRVRERKAVSRVSCTFVEAVVGHYAFDTERSWGMKAATGQCIIPQLPAYEYLSFAYQLVSLWKGRREASPALFP